MEKDLFDIVMCGFHYSRDMSVTVNKLPFEKHRFLLVLNEYMLNLTNPKGPFKI